MLHFVFDKSNQNLKNKDDKIPSKEEILNAMNKINIQKSLMIICRSKDRGMTKREISRNFSTGYNQLPEKLKEMHKNNLVKKYLIKTKGRDRIAYFLIDKEPNKKYDFVEIPYNENEEY